MSVQALAAAFSLEIESPTVKLVLLGLANYCDQKGRCWPSQKELSLLTSLSERAIRDALGVLVASGIVSREERRRPDGSRSTDVITLLFLQPASAAACENETKTQAASAAGGGARRAGGGAPAAGPTTFEPSKDISPVANAPGESARADIDKSKGKRLPLDWRPEKLVGVDDGRCTVVLAQTELAKFRDYWTAQPGVKGRKVDWEATWRNWLRGTLDRLPPTPTERSTSTFDADALAKRKEENRRRYGDAA
jgi:hypothetical protein